MKVTGTSHLTAEPALVWRALNDPATLVGTIPGCQRLEAVGGDVFKMTISAGVGSIKGVYDGEVRLTDQREPGSFRMHAQGAGAPGTIGADVLVTLAPADQGGTELTYDAEATVGGMIGGVGQRMLAGVSKKMAAEFFRNVDQALSAVPAGLPVGGAAPKPSTVAAPPTGHPSDQSVGQVFTAPTSPRTAAGVGGAGFALGVAVGAAAALAGALVGAWIASRSSDVGAER